MARECSARRACAAPMVRAPQERASATAGYRRLCRTSSETILPDFIGNHPFDAPDVVDLLALEITPEIL